MYRYVFKKFKDTIEFGFNVRRCTQAINKTNCYQNNDVQHNAPQNSSVLKYQEVNFLVPTTQRVNYDDFKKKYNCKHPNSNNPFLQAITWSTALIAGFYASQLLCLYRRNQHFDPKKCFYGRYLQHKNKLIHRKLLCFEQAKAQNRSHNKSIKFSGCPLKRKIQERRTKKADEKNRQYPKTDDEFKAFTEEFASLNLFDKRFEQFFKADDDLTIGGHRKVFYKVNNNDDTLFKAKEHKESTSADNNTNNTNNVKSDLSADQQQQQKSEDEVINEIMTNLSEMIGELEFQMGVQCVLHGNYEKAVEHFRMSSSSNNASACYNLALLYEQGLGVKKDLEIAMKLYKMASDQGHDKALYNMGVYSARGLGGAKKSFKKAKSYFEKAATYGNVDAIEALSLLLPEKKKASPLLIVPNFIVDDDVGMELMVSKNIHHFNNLQSIAVT